MKKNARSIHRLIRSLQLGKEPHGLTRKDELGELARIFNTMKNDLDSGEINLHTMMIERERQEYLMRTIDQVAFTLLGTAVEDEEEFEYALREGMTVVAQCVDVDGIYVWRNIIQDDGNLFDLESEWANSIGRVIRGRSGTRYYYKNVPGWEEEFISGLPLSRTRSELTSLEQEVLGPITKSILILPVHLHEHFWGLVFFEDCKREREFTVDEVNLLQSASIMIVSAVRRKKQAQRIIEAHARVKLMMDATPIGCFLWDLDLQIFDCNPASLELFRADSKEELSSVRKSLAPVYQPCGRPSNELIDEHLAKAFAEGSHDFEWICQAMDGTLFTTEINLRRVPFAGEYVVAEYVRDTREQKRLMYELEHRGRQLEKALLEAQAASQAKSNFLSNMSHEIRTPLNAITGMTTIGQSAKSWQDKDDAFRKIESASSHLLGVINDILDMSKIEAGKLEIYEEPFDIERTLSKVLNIIMFKIEEKNQIFKMDVDENVPPMIVGDDQRLTQVLTNLLGNAVKFTPEGKEIRLDIAALESEANRCKLKFSVIDQGIGISKEQQSRLFTSFTQAEADTTRKFGGTGLGLAISKHIIDLMGGDIWIESELGHGATFSFVIEVEISGKEQESVYQGENLENMKYPGKVLLLAEDMEINREIVMAILSPAEIVVDCAENGEEAVMMFEKDQARYHMIFMDVQMPVMDGFEASRRIRGLGTDAGRNVPIVAMTANVFRDDVEKCLEAGMNAHLGKPLDLDAVMETLWKYLG